MVLVKFNGTGWVDAKSNEPHLYLDGFLKKKLDKIKFMQAKDWDCIFVIVGMEGSGKSTLSFTLGQYLFDMKLTINHIAAGSDDALDKLKALPDGSLLIIDEAELLFSSKDTMTREQKQLTKVFMIIRQKKMVLILVSPSFFDLSKYIAVDRSRFLIRTYTDRNLNRGYYAYWGQKKKKKLYKEGKRSFGSYSKPKADFVGKFTNYILPFNEEYQKTKMKSLMEAFSGSKKESIRLTNEQIKDIKYEIAYNLWILDKRMTLELLATAIGVAKSTLRDRIKRIRLEKDKNKGV